MTSESIDWDEDLPADPEEEYQTFIRTLERTEGFRLLFVRCTPAEGEQLIARVQEELPQKTIEVLRLDAPIDNLYTIVERLPNREQINILFIQGLEHSFYEYEKKRFGETSERLFPSWHGVPRILNHLNQQRERFRDNFNICFVFLLRSFSLKYFIHRAPDFFDWRSSVFEFPTEPELLEQESSRIFLGGEFQKYLDISSEERFQKILEIQELLEEDHQVPSYKANLLIELGNLLAAAQEYEAAIASFDQAIEFKPDDDRAWTSRGLVLNYLGQHEEAIVSFDKSLAINPNSYASLYNRGIALHNIQRYEEAVASYDKALAIKPNYCQAWSSRGRALRMLGCYEEAIASCDRAIELQPDCSWAWYYRGSALYLLSNLNEAIASFDKAISLQPDYYNAWAARNVALDLLGAGKPDKPEREWINSLDNLVWKGIMLANLGSYEEAIACYDKILERRPDNAWVLYNRGNAMRESGRYKEAIVSYYKALFSKDTANLLRQTRWRGKYQFLVGRLKILWLGLLRMISFRR